MQNKFHYLNYFLFNLNHFKIKFINQFIKFIRNLLFLNFFFPTHLKKCNNIKII